jgi:hypothetical protein
MAATLAEVAFCGLELERTNCTLLYSGTSERDTVNLHLQGSKSIYNYSQEFQNTGCLWKRKSSERPPVSQAAQVCEAYEVDNTCKL